MKSHRPTKMKSQILPPQSPPTLKGLESITYGQEVCQNLSLASSKEWMITNGLGGYASSTILGMNTRATHGLLVAATRPPTGRVVMVSKLEETLVDSSGRYELSTNQHPGVVHPEGYRYLVQFHLDPWPTFLYRIGEVILEKSILLLPGENALVVGYKLHAAPGPLEMSVRPLLAMRTLSQLRHEERALDVQTEKTKEGFTVRFGKNLPALLIQHTAEIFEESPCWYHQLEYIQEAAGQRVVVPLPLAGAAGGFAPNRRTGLTGERQADRTRVCEDLWSPGTLRYLLQVGESYAFVASTGRRGGADLTFHQRRVENTQTVFAQTMKPPGVSPLALRLSWTAQHFITRPTPQESGESFLMAGLPDLPPAGREALIALPGLALSSGRFDLARSVLETLSARLKDGLIPVRLIEGEGSPEYDSADTSLWFYTAVWHYWKVTRDLRFIKKKLLDPLQQIMEGYLEGTTFGIGMDEDGLIELPDEEISLTWMDATEPARSRGARQSSGESGGPGRVGVSNKHRDVPGKAVTPRFGKPVEINALWYCALMIMATLTERMGLKQTSTYQRLSRLVGRSFIRTFVSPSGFLYDRVTPEGPDSSIRPNMLIATGLPFHPLSRAQVARVLSVVEKELLTPVGIRTLSPRDSQYRGQISGNFKVKAHAKHQGTVWTWLIGSYVRSLLGARRLTRATQASIAKQLRPYGMQCREQGLGAVGEMFDGDPPHSPRGTLWSLAAIGEILKTVQDAKLGDL